MDPTLHVPETTATGFEPVLTSAMAGLLAESLPFETRFATTGWRLAFCPCVHGASLGTLYRTGEDLKRTILLIRDEEGHVFGGYAPMPWFAKPGRLYYGTDEAFVFSFGKPGASEGGPEESLRTFPALPGGQTMFMFAGVDMLAMGGGSDAKAALTVQSDLLRGTSHAAETFANPPLASGEDFIVQQLELWVVEGDFND
mmetsp:Transcript_131080/g.261547  ORF Transcript_131080/g.261547 Transcript_131080/m.261547 type:complete len:199 (-) Transcript_131080:128-724(-)